MIKIAAYIPNPSDGTSFYRGVGPLSELERQFENEIRVDFKKYCSLADIKGYDIVLFQRPFRKEEVESMKLCKQFGIPVVLDYDDNLFNVPVNNVFREINARHGNDYEVHVRTSLELADMVFVSTQELDRQLSQVVPNSYVVVNNAWDNEVLKFNEDYNYGKTILWRGGHSHVSDLHVYKNKFEELVRKNRDFDFIFLGEPPVWASNYKNTTLIKTVSLHDFFRIFRMLEPSLLLVPLKDYAFNKTKSNISKLEATIHGAISLCPEWEEFNWNNEDEHLYNNPAEFYDEATDVLEKLRDKDIQLKQEWQYCRDYIKANYSLDKMNMIRFEAFSTLLDTYKQSNDLSFYGGSIY